MTHHWLTDTDPDDGLFTARCTHCQLTVLDPAVLDHGVYPLECPPPGQHRHVLDLDDDGISGAGCHLCGLHLAFDWTTVFGPRPQPAPPHPSQLDRPQRHWRDLAVCRQVDPELFFPDSPRTREHDRQVAAAKAVCAVCPVRGQCLAFALDALPDGIAGGMTPAERHEHARRHGRRAGDRWSGELLAGVTRTQRADAGRAALRAGRPVREVARECGVTERTAQRWASQAHTETGTTSSAAPGAGRGAA